MGEANSRRTTRDVLGGGGCPLHGGPEPCWGGEAGAADREPRAASHGGGAPRAVAAASGAESLRRISAHVSATPALVRVEAKISRFYRDWTRITPQYGE